jgi:hypothetical protein
MDTTPLPGTLAIDTNLTGNSAYTVDASGTLWLVIGDATAGGAAIFSSANQGITWTLVESIADTLSSTIAFDPVLAVDSSGNLHILGQVLVTGGIQLVKYTWTPGTPGTLSGPFVIEIDGFVGADYDMVALANGNCYAVSCLITTTQETIQGLEINAAGVVVVITDVYVTQPFGTGSRYGAVSLYTPDGVAVEVYLNSHPKVVTFQDFTVTLSMTLRSSGDSVGTPTVLTTFQARHIDNKLTILGSGATRYLSLCYYTQSERSLVGNMLLGYAPSSDNWSFQPFTGSPTASMVEPTLSLSSAGLVLAYLTRDFTSTAGGDCPVTVVSLDPTRWLRSPRDDFFFTATASFLRGAQTVLATSMPWGFLAQRVTDLTARFYTGYNPPPTVTLSPSGTLAARRGVVYDFDASGSFSPNGDTLEFTWSLTDPTGEAIFIPDGDQASLMLPLAVGPSAYTLTVTVSVVATDGNGNILHTAVTQDTTVTYAEVSLPVITAVVTQDVARNATVTFSPTVTDADGDSLTYSWMQQAGTMVDVISSDGSATLVFTTNGAAIAGETLGFLLTVSDGINTSVTATFDFAVAARAASGETKVWNRASFSGNLAARNVTGTWGSPAQITDSSAPIVTEFTSVKRASLIGGVRVAAMLGPNAVFIVRTQTGLTATGYHVLPISASDTIVDAVHSDTDATLILTSSGLIEQFLPNASATDTDNAVAVLPLSAVTAKTFMHMQITPSFAGSRVITLYGTQGVLLILVDTNTLQALDSLDISVESGMLYGTDNIDFVRTGDMESLSSGVLLIGSHDSSGNEFIDKIGLSPRATLGTFNAANLGNPAIDTGELLNLPNDSYAGQPMAPVLAVPVPSANGYLLAWAQTRTDLVNGYDVYISQDSVTFNLMAPVTAGQITSVYLPALAPGRVYSFKVRAVSDDGLSAYSNIVELSL